MGVWRLIGMYEKGMSSEIPELPSYWRLETKHVDTKYPTFEKDAMKDNWTRDIDFILEPRLLEDFSEKVFLSFSSKSLKYFSAIKCMRIRKNG